MQNPENVIYKCLWGDSLELVKSDVQKFQN